MIPTVSARRSRRAPQAKAAAAKLIAGAANDTLTEREAKEVLALYGVPVVGDSLRDLIPAAAMGGQPYLVLTGKGMKTQAKGDLPEGTIIMPDLAAVVEKLV